jgi:carbon storage regulator CsrA
MLVLSRKHEEKLHIGDNITVTVLRVQGNKVRLGIEAPDEVRVVRGELPRHPNPDTPAKTANSETNRAPGQLSSRAAAIVAKMMANSSSCGLKSEIA